ncbi:MAG: hypothetical protein ACP5J4_00180 [Anaerolineae bacterium]
MMIEHFVKIHRLVPAHYYTRLLANYGFVVGLIFGIAVGLLLLNNGLYLPVASVAGLILGATFGWIVDARVKHEQRVL